MSHLTCSSWPKGRVVNRHCAPGLVTLQANQRVSTPYRIRISLSRLGCQKENGRDFAPVRQIGKRVAKRGKSLPRRLASRVHGYADEHECDDNHQRCDDDLHSYTSPPLMTVVASLDVSAVQYYLVFLGGYFGRCSCNDNHAPRRRRDNSDCISRLPSAIK